MAIRQGHQILITAGQRQGEDTLDHHTYEEQPYIHGASLWTPVGDSACHRSTLSHSIREACDRLPLGCA